MIGNTSSSPCRTGCPSASLGGSSRSLAGEGRNNIRLGTGRGSAPLRPRVLRDAFASPQDSEVSRPIVGSRSPRVNVLGNTGERHRGAPRSPRTTHAHRPARRPHSALESPDSPRGPSASLPSTLPTEPPTSAHATAHRGVPLPPIPKRSGRTPQHRLSEMVR